MKKIILLLTFIGLAYSPFAQVGEDDYISEFTWGINKNTNSGLIGGVIFKLARQKKENLFTVYGIEFLNIRHPKEQKYLSPTSGTSFVWGKENHLYSIRGIYGLERILFRKAPQQGVQISLIGGGGPTVGLVAPYYILYNGRYVPYDSDIHRNRGAVQGAGKLFQGLGESNVTLGVNGKVGLSFEFGAFKNNVAGIELGISGEAFTKQIELVPTQKNRAAFSALYFTMYWGTRR